MSDHTKLLVAAQKVVETDKLRQAVNHYLAQYDWVLEKIYVQWPEATGSHGFSETQQALTKLVRSDVVRMRDSVDVGLKARVKAAVQADYIQARLELFDAVMDMLTGEDLVSFQGWVEGRLERIAELKAMTQ